VSGEEAICCPPIEIGNTGDEVFEESEEAEDTVDLGVIRGKKNTRRNSHKRK
jgi:hypothetical protein